MKTDVLTVFFQGGRGNHHRRRVRQNINKGRERLLQRNFHRRGIDRFRAGDVFKQVITFEMVVGITGPIQVDLDRLGIKVGAILKLHA